MVQTGTQLQVDGKLTWAEWGAGELAGGLWRSGPGGDEELEVGRMKRLWRRLKKQRTGDRDHGCSEPMASQSSDTP